MAVATHETKYKTVKDDLPQHLQQKYVKYSTSWIKFSKPKQICFMGRDAICIASGCFLLVHHLITKVENIVNINDDAGGGYGASCIAGHQTHSFIAYAEKREHPRVFLLTYPELKYAQPLFCEFYDIVKLAFSDGELLFGISGYPECSLIVWKWRTAEIMAVLHTGLFFNRNIMLSASYLSQPLYLTQVVKHTTEMKIWEVACCGKKCILLSEVVTFEHEDPRLQIVDLLWTMDGLCFTLDKTGNVFKLDFETHVMKKIISATCGSSTAVAAFCWYNNGLMVQSADNQMRHYLKETNWELNTTWKQEQTFIKMYSRMNRDYLILLTEDQNLLCFDSKTETYSDLREDEAQITCFGLVPPQFDTLVTLGKQINMSLWESNTGKLIHSITLESPAIQLRCNEQYPYAAVGFENGLVRLYSCHKNILEPMCQFQLTRIPIQKIRFFESCRVLVAANLDIGQLFVVEGVPGGKFKVISSITHQSQIIDFLAVGARSCLRLFVIPVTSDKFLAGNKIVRYCIVKNMEATVKTYELENPERLYYSLYVTRNHPFRDRLIYAAPLDSKFFYELELKRGDTHARVVNKYKSHHMMRMIFYSFEPLYNLSYGYDGLIILLNETFDIQYVVIPHHRYDGGVSRAYYDPHKNRLISMGREGVLTCSQLPGPQQTMKQQAMLYAKAEELADMFKQPTIGFNPRGIYQGLSWLEYKEKLKIESERIKFAKQKQQIVNEFLAIQKRALILLDHNMHGPEKEKLELQDFNLNLLHKDELVRSSRDQCERLKYYLEKLIQDYERIAMLIKKHFWDIIDVHMKNIWAIFGNFAVQNYAVLPFDAEEAKILERIDIYRTIEIMCAQDDSFQPWNHYSEEDKEILLRPPRLDQEKKTSIVPRYDDDDDAEAEAIGCADENETFVAYFGSSFPYYIEISEQQYNQQEVQSLIQYHWTTVLSSSQQLTLREYFNKEFEVLVQAKVREMSSIIERNARLRYVISELNYFSEDQLDIELYEPYWRQDENPILITKVENDEVGILPYVSPSEQALLDAKAAEEERIRLLLLADDFKERALMKMMNGVLETRWEDELRKEVTKPKCLSEKNPEDYNEEDLRQIKEYDEAVRFLESERRRYKNILYAEYAKVGGSLREGVKKFNDKLQELFVKKIQIESALHSEMLRIHRLRLNALKREQKDKAEIDIEEEIKQTDLNTEEYATLIASLNTYDDDLKTYMETLLNKEKLVEKAFKREIQDCSQPQVELLMKLYKRRPKSNLKGITSPCTILEMAKVIGSKSPSLLLFGDDLEYARGVDMLDKFTGLPNFIDENLFNSMVRVRRMKIEVELKIRACQLENAEAEVTQEMYISHLTKSKEHKQALLTNLENIRAEKVKNLLNVELQLVIKSGFVEIPRSGSMKDFEDSMLVNRKEVEDINTIILDTGALKIKAMRNALQFRKEIMIKEWQHKRKKMEISDLEHEIVDIRSIRLTKEIQQFLRTRSRGDTEKIMSFEQELDSLKEQYYKRIMHRHSEIRELKGRLEILTAEQDRLKREIMKVNIDVNESNIIVDHDLTEKEAKLTNIRIQANLKRARLVSQIQANHNEILMLQAELELCRLKTVPILEYKIDS